MEKFLTIVIPYATYFLEIIGVFIIVIGTIQAVWGLIKSKLNFGNTKVKIQLAKSLELALEFKLAAEILKTVLIQTTEELYILSAIVILRVIMTFVIHWEIKNANPDELQ